MALEPAVSLGAGVIPAWYRPISVDEYHQMIDAGVFDEDDRLELLEGVIVSMSLHCAARWTPRACSQHALAIEVLDELLRRGLDPRLNVRCQLPLTLARSEPEPDVAIVQRRRPRRGPRHPGTAVLCVEVAGESLDKDRVKASVYAEAGVTEYWIVDLAGRRVEVFSDPDRSRRRYRAHVVVKRGTLGSVSVVSVSVPVASLFAKRR